MQTSLTVTQQKSAQVPFPKYYVIRADPEQSGGPVWLTNEAGEGIPLFDEELFQMLDKHFKENF